MSYYIVKKFKVGDSVKFSQCASNHFCRNCDNCVADAYKLIIPENCNGFADSVHGTITEIGKSIKGTRGFTATIRVRHRAPRRTDLSDASHSVYIPLSLLRASKLKLEFVPQKTSIFNPFSIL